MKIFDFSLIFLIRNVSKKGKDGIIKVVSRMLKSINGLNVNYVSYGKKGTKEIVFLHGWGQNIEMMRPVGDNLEKEYHITIIDLPGFGRSEEPKYVFSLFDYVELLHQLLIELEIKKPILAGHSFGGKISLLYASKYDVEKLILFGSPFRPGLKKMPLKTKILKSIKKLPGMEKLASEAKKHIGSTDYRNASPLMRKIMVDHVNLDITEEVKEIKAPTIIIWGDLDQAVPLQEAYVLENLISDSAVIVYEGCTHYAYLERLGQTVNIIKSFIKE